MDLKEYIKSLVREMLDEESATDAIGVGAGPIMTPKAFAKKGQKSNAATKQAERSGWKKAKGMPKHSKMLDYKELWKGKKSSMNEFSDYDKPSTYGAKSGYSSASGYTGPSLASKGGGYYKDSVKENQMKLNDIIDQELLNEVTYHSFKKDVKFRTKSEMLHKAIREVKKKLSEIDRLVEYTSRMKQELSEGEDGIRYWKNTQKNVGQIAEMVNHLNNKIKNLNQ